MAKTGNLLRILTICVFIGIVSCKSKKKTLPQKQVGPPLPPLLPPVPPIQQIEYLTRQQLAFIRHHQQLQKSEKGVYNPYACLPKYICIVEDEAGDKRTTIVSSLHPALRDIDKQEDTNSGPSIGKIHVPQLAVLGHYDPEGLYRDRIVDDGFLKDQEEREKFALAQSLRGTSGGVGGFSPFEAKLKPSSGPSKGSGEETSSSDNNSDESNEDTNDDDGDDNDDNESQEGDEQNASSAVNKSRRRQPPGFPPRSFEDITSDTSGDHIATVPWSDKPTRPATDQKKNEQPSRGSSGSFLRRMLFRSKRDTKQQPKNPFMTKLGPGIKSSDQCRILYNGCDLKYDEIMRIASAGQVLIEKDDPIKPKPASQVQQTPVVTSPPEDDEVEQAQREASLKSKNKKKPGFGGNKIKYPAGPPKHPGHPNSPYNKHIKMKPKPFYPAEDEVDGLPIASLPVLPMKFHFGKPIVPVKKGGQYQPQEVSFGETPNFRPMPQRPTTTTPTPPIFVKNPVYKKVNRTSTVTNVVQVNSTHAVKIVKPTTKPYRPVKAPLTDSNGRPVSFASVFTEIAGSSGGIHDFFDKVALAVGGPPANKKRVQKKIESSSPSDSPSSSQSITRRGGEVSSEEEEDEEEDEADDDETPEHNNDEEESGEDDQEGDDAEDDVGSSQDDLGDEAPVKKEESTQGSSNTSGKKVFKYKVSNKKKESKGTDAKEEVNKNKKKNQEDEVADEEDQEGDDEELNDDAEVDVDLPEFLPDHIKQGIIEDIKNPGKRQKEAAAAGKKAQASKGGDDEEEDDEDGSVEQPVRPGGGGGPGGRPQPHGGRPGGPPGGGMGGPPGGFGGQRPGGSPIMRQRPSFFRHGQPNGQGPNSNGPQGPPPPRRGMFSIF